MAMFLKGSFFDNIIQGQRTFMDNMILLILSRFLLANDFHFFKQLVEKRKCICFKFKYLTIKCIQFQVQNILNSKYK